MFPEPYDGSKALESLWVDAKVDAVVADGHGFFNVFGQDLDIEEEHLLSVV